MEPPFPIALSVLGLVLAKWLAELWLEWLNRRHLLAHADSVPEALRQLADPVAHAQSIPYTLAKSRFRQVAGSFDTLVLVSGLFSGVLPWAYSGLTGWWGGSVWALAGALFAVALVLSLLGLPFQWYAQFRIEEQFGFNTTTPRTWWADRLKGLSLSTALGYPLLALLLQLPAWAGAAWWVWAWGCVLGFQLLITLLAPVLILPLFNKFTPLPEGPLRERLLALAQRAGFRAQGIQLMDGSKRSRHANAFFTGFGRFRRIVLLDTLVDQLAAPEVEAVLAHEIGHYRRQHIPKLLAWSALSLLAACYVVAWLSRQESFYSAFGFNPGELAPALLLCGLLSGAVGFWFGPLAHLMSRRYEYQADQYAAAAMGEAHTLIEALRKLAEHSLVNLTPHPLYSAFHYSHPTWLERQRRLQRDQERGLATARTGPQPMPKPTQTR